MRRLFGRLILLIGMRNSRFRKDVLARTVGKLFESRSIDAVMTPIAVAEMLLGVLDGVRPGFTEQDVNDWLYDVLWDLKFPYLRNVKIFSVEAHEISDKGHYMKMLGCWV